MNDSIKKISLDIHNTSSGESVNAKRGDTGRKICISLVDGGIPYTISKECYAVFTAKKPDGKVVYNDCSIENNTIIYKITEQTVAAEGRVNCEIKLYGADNKLITSPKFTIMVYGTVYNEGDEVESSSEFSALTRLVSDATEAVTNANEAAMKAAHTAKSLMVIGSANGNSIHLDDAIDQFLVGLRIFGKTTQDSAPTPDTPVDLVSAGDGSVQVRVTGKNLLDVPELITFTKAHQKNMFIPKGTYVVSCGNVTSSGDNQPAMGFFDAKGARLSTVSLTANKTVTVTFKNDIVRFYIYSNGWSDSGSTGISATIERLMISAGEGDYEAYKEQTFVISTPNGFHGIPVSSGGNYTDANGQQWFCDEIDLNRRVRVQRCFKETVNPTYNASNDRYNATLTHNANLSFSSDSGIFVLCDKLPFNSKATKGVNGIRISTASTNLAIAYYNGENPGALTVVYPLEAPIETPLSEEELAAFAALRTYRGNTTVSNDTSAYMEIEYVMDAKKYIDSLMKAVPRVVSVNLPASKWVGSGTLYSQVVSIAGITENSQVNLTPSVEQLSIFYDKDISFITENDGGVVTIYVIGQKPQNDYTIQADIVEVI